MALLLPALARAETPSEGPDLQFHKSGTALIVGTAGLWTLNRPGIDWLNLKLDHCDAVERELKDCQALPSEPKGFGQSTAGVTLKVAGTTVVIVVVVVAADAAIQKVQDVIHSNVHW